MADDRREVIVTDIKIPFWSMVVLMVKWAVAAIPALIILLVSGAVLSTVIASIFVGGKLGMLTPSATAPSSLRMPIAPAADASSVQATPPGAIATTSLDGTLLPQKAKVLSFIDSGKYTYLETSQNGETLWLATTTVKVRKGDVIRFDDGMVMTNFNSKTLNRTFPSITFVNRLVVTNVME